MIHPLWLSQIESVHLSAITSTGHMLIFPMQNLPLLPKGNKIIYISSKRAATGEELITHLALLPEGASMTIFAGKRFFKLTDGNLMEFSGERGRRGRKLPRAFQNVERLTVEASARIDLLPQ